MVLLAAAAVTLAACRQAPPPTGPADDLVAQNNRAVALMGRFQFDEARTLFETLSAQSPNRLDLLDNLAIATLNRQREGDEAAAQAMFERVLSSDPKNLRAQYGLGLLLLHAGKAQEARPHFQAVLDARPDDADATYFAAQSAFSLGDYEAALRGYERARTLDPHLRSASYGLFLAYQRLGRADDARRSLDAFQELEGNPQSRVVEFKYTRMGPLSEVATIDEPPRAAVAPPSGPAVAATPVPLLSSVTLPAGWTWHSRDGDRPPGITTVDLDGDGRLDIFVTSAFDVQGQTRNAVLINQGSDRFALDTSHPLAAVTGVNAALWGDYDNDGLTDVYFCRRGPNQLWRQTASARWSDVTAAARAAGPGGDTVDGAFFDADHEGDLDLLLVRANGPNELLNNNGDGIFRPIAQQAGIAGDGRPSRGVVVADLDNDRDLDLVVLKASPPHDVFVNDRLWRYRRATGANPLAEATIQAAVAGDTNADGRVEIYATDNGGITRWTMDRAGVWTSAPIAGTEALAGSRQLALADLRGDGRLNLIGSKAAGGWQVRTLPDSGTSEVVAESSAATASWTIAVLTPSGPSIVALPAAGDAAPVAWHGGTGRWPFVTVSFTGRDSKADQLRSNVSGIGTRIAARTDSRWTAITAVRPQSGPGQSLQPIAIGTGGARQIDFVTLTWSDGVLQTEIGLEAGRLHRIEETQRQLSSCPVLFAFDGRRFAFVTDVLGVGGVGFLEQPGVYSAARPRENLLLPIGLLATRNDRYQLKIAEPMEEVLYLDRAELVAYDLPPGWDMTLDERKEISGPVPSGSPRFFRALQLPARAETSEGEDATAAVSAVDGVAASPGRIDRRFIGRTADHALTLYFDLPVDAGPGQATLVADGWIEYPYAQTIFAAWQAGAPYRAPTLEARDRSGRWQTILEEFGYPAGMPRQMSVPLPRLPRGTTALRLHTTQEVYWDRLAIAHVEPEPHVVRRPLALETAQLATTGYARRTTARFRRPSYDYDARVPLWDARHLRGFYTAEGRVDALLAATDGAVAIVGPGEEVHLEFSARIDPPPAGWTRRFVIELRGWCKDMDLYTEHGETVEPIPGPMTPARATLHERFNTRFASGY